MIKGLKVLAVIPARLNSSRLPNKPLIKIGNKPLIYYTYSNLKSNLIDKKIIATDSQKIVDEVKKFKGEIILTKKSHKNGSERIAEVAKKFPKYDIILNIQGDEPEVTNDAIKKLLQPFVLKSNKNKIFLMTTLKVQISLKEAKNPNVVKVITNKKNQAIYFSRSLIPYYQDKVKNPVYYKHLGLYGFSRKYLFSYISLPMSDLEKKESLEQLRVIENKDTLYVSEIKKDLIDINTPADIKKFKKSFSLKKSYFN